MAAIRIIEKTGGFFEFQIDGVNVYENTRNDLTIEPKGNNIKHCHFKTANGANILKLQEVLITDVTLEAVNGTTISPQSSVALWLGLHEIHYFDWIGSAGGGGGGGGGVNRFAELMDAFAFQGNNGKVPMVNEGQLRLDPVTFYNKQFLTELNDVSISPIHPIMVGKVIGVDIVNNQPRFVLTDPLGNTSTPPNALVSIGDITQNGNTFTIPANASWRINGNMYSNPAAYPAVIQPAADGNNRIDIIVANVNNTFSVWQGEENAGFVYAPITPANTVLVTTVNISGAVATPGDPPVIGDLYVTKASKGTYYISADGVIESLPRDYRTLYLIKDSVTEIWGLDYNAVNTNNDNLYVGQEFKFLNRSENPITLKNMHPDGQIKFNIPSEQDLIIPPGYATEFYFSKEDYPQLNLIGTFGGGSVTPHYQTDVAIMGSITVPAGFVPMVVNLNRGRVLDQGTEWEMMSATELKILYAFEDGDTVSIAGFII